MRSTDFRKHGGSSSSDFRLFARQTPNALHFTKNPDLSSLELSSLEASTSNKSHTLNQNVPFRHVLRHYLCSEIDTTWSDLPLICCGYVSGLIDALSYNSWGNFSNMHTGRYNNIHSPEERALIMALHVNR